MSARKAGQSRQQEPLDETFAGADAQFDRLARTREPKFLQRGERLADDFIEPLSGISEFHRTMPSFEQFDAKVFFQFLELTTVLALPVRVSAGGCRDASGRDNFPEGFQPLQR